MKCNNCGFENNHDANFCLSCGTELKQQPATLTPFAQTVHSALTDKLFLAICVLLTVGTALSVTVGSPNVLGILATIFSWLVFSKVKSGTVDSKNLRNLSGTVYASYVITNAVSIIFIVLGAILLFICGLVAHNEIMLTAFKEAFTYNGISGVEFTNMFVQIMVVVMGIMFIAIGIVDLVINNFGFSKIHKFVKSVYQGIDSGLDPYTPQNAKTTNTWLWVYGIIGAFGGLTSVVANPVTALSQICFAAVYIVSALLINKYFLTPAPQITLPQPTAEPEPVAQHEKPDQPTE